MAALRSSVAGIVVLAAVAWGQVTLSTGVTVPKDHFIVYICVGNSEMEGQTQVPPSDRFRPVWDTTSLRLWNFNVQDTNNPGPNHTWIPAHGKNHAGSLAQYPNWLGPDMPFLKQLAKQYSSDYYFGILKIANQGDRLRGQYLLNQPGWDPDCEWTQIVDAISAIGPSKVTWGGVLTIFCDMEVNDVHQGYSGANGKLDSLAYDAMTLTTRLRQQTGSNMPLLFACPPGNYDNCVNVWGRRDIWDSLNTQLTRVPTLDARAAAIPMWWADTATVMSVYVQHTGGADDGHYTDTGLIKLAEVAVGLIKTNNWVPSPGADTAPPTAPTNLSASTIGATSVTLAWSPSTDDKGVSGYIVYRNGDSVATVALTSATIAGLASSTAYAFAVKAFDFSGKLSTLSTPLQVTTAAPGSDTQPPSVPSGLHAVSVGLTSAVIAWSASSDNVGVAGYIVYQGGAPIDTVTATQDTINALTQQTTYSFTVVARDAAGNVSSPSSPLSVTTGNPVAFPFRVNVGGPAIGAYLADKQWTGTDYGYTGTTSVAVGSGDVTGTTNDSVYYTERVGADLGYQIAVPTGLYDITFMFAEFWHAAGSRVFTPFINGVAATAQPIDVAAAVGLSAAYTVTVRKEITGGLIAITFTHQGGNTSGEVPILNGLVVDNAPAYTIVSPTGNDTCHVGDTLHVRWQANTYLVTGADIYLSADDGDSWRVINAGGTIYAHDSTWGDYPFVVPQSIGGVSIVNTPLILKISGYGGEYQAVMNGTLTVLPSAAVAVAVSRTVATPQVRMVDGRRGVLEGLPVGGSWRLDICALNGAVVRRLAQQVCATPMAAFELPGPGVYLASLQITGRHHAFRLIAQ